MTIKKLNNLIIPFSGFGKTDEDLKKLFDIFNQYGLMLLDGDVNYSPDMTSKRYNYRIAEEIYNEEFNQTDEGKTVGYLTVLTCWRTGNLEEPYEILSYVS